MSSQDNDLLTFFPLMARICYTSVIIQYYEDQQRLGKSLDQSVVLVPEDTELLDAAIAYLL